MKSVKLKIYGIYKIWFENATKTPEGDYKVYVGLGDIHGRKSDHVSYLKRNAHGNDLLQRAFNKYGLENMRFAVIETCDVSILEEREIYWIAQHNSNNPAYGYNLTSGGQRTILSEISRAKQSESMKGNQNGKGRIVPEHAKEATSIANKGNKYNLGKKRSPEVAAKAWETMRKNGYVRQPWSEETRKNHEASKFHHTQETKEVIAEASRRAWETRDRTVSEETREKISNGRKGKRMSQEAIDRAKESLKKVVHDEEWNKKVSEGLLKRAERIRQEKIARGEDPNPKPRPKDKSGIYKITFSGSDYSFVDYTEGLKRKNRYISERLEEQRHVDKEMQKLYNEFGSDSYAFTVLEYCDSIDVAIKIEWYKNI